jgi:hypothetical protein
MKDYRKNIKESVTIIKIQGMCEESLSPEMFEKWEEVKYWLIKNRKLNQTRIERILKKKLEETS